jgi:phenylacetic acid degradation operon negative regulatory protein
MASAHVVQLLGDAGLTTSSARTNLSRLKAKGLLATEPRDGVPGYRLTHEAHPMLARGDRRIYGHPQMTTKDPWLVVVFSVPETRRNLRHRLRSQLTWLGCGSVAPGVWIGPGHLLEETREVLTEVGLERYTTLFCTTTPQVHGDLRDAVRQWWDLEALSERYTSFISGHEAAAQRAADGDLTDREAFVLHLRALDH